MRQPGLRSGPVAASGTVLSRLRAGHGLPLVLLAALACGVGMRFAVSLGQGLWEDEVIAATHAAQPLPDLVIQVIRYDVHPPLYFLQLHVWGLLGHSDLWLLLNSVFWGLAALVSLGLVTWRQRGPEAAWVGAAALAVLPSGLWMSQELRPYAWMSVLLIWAYHLAVRCHAAPDLDRRAGWRLRAGLLALLLGLIYSHALGFLGVLCNGLFAAGLLLRRRAPVPAFRAWLLLYGLAGLASLPVLVNGLLHDANLGSSPSFGAMLSWLPSSLGGSEVDGWLWLGGLLAYAGLAGAGLAQPRTRLMSLCFLVLPLLVAGVLAVAATSVFKPNIFAALAAPFLAMVTAELILAARPAWRTAAAGAGLAALLALAIGGWADKRRATDFLPLATDLRARPLQPGDAVYAPQSSVFWGLARYLSGPDWGSPLAIADLPSPQWQAVYARLGLRVVSALGLMPRTQELPLPGSADLLVGRAAEAAAARHRRVWLVIYPRADLPPDYPPDRLGLLRRGPESKYKTLILIPYAPE